MSIEENIVAAIDSLFDGRVYPDTGPFNSGRPMCCYQFVGGRPSNTFCGNTDKQNYRIQFWVWSDRRETSNSLMRQVEALLTQPPYYGVSQGGLVSRFDEATKRYGAQQDLSFWL